MRIFLSNLLLFGVSLAFLVHFLLIYALGELEISEPNTTILCLEILVMVRIMVFAVDNVIKQQRR